jgi:hypothetical protein
VSASQVIRPPHQGYSVRAYFEFSPTHTRNRAQLTVGDAATSRVSNTLHFGTGSSPHGSISAVPAMTCVALRNASSRATAASCTLSCPSTSINTGKQRSEHFHTYVGSSKTMVAASMCCMSESLSSSAARVATNTHNIRTRWSCPVAGLADTANSITILTFAVLDVLPQILLGQSAQRVLVGQAAGVRVQGRRVDDAVMDQL